MFVWVVLTIGDIIEAYGRIMRSLPNNRIEGALFESEDFKGEYQLVKENHEQNAEQRLRGFYKYASQEAKALLELLAVVPLSLPIVKLVQQKLLPYSNQEHLSEVFMSSIIDKEQKVDGFYQFSKYENEEVGVRDELIKKIGAKKAFQTIVQLSEVIQQQGGVFDFLAFVIDPKSLKQSDDFSEIDREFARISVDLLKQMGAKYSHLADRLEESFEEFEEESNQVEKISDLFNDISVLPLGYILNSKYKIINALGKGGFGIVYKVEDIETKEIFAIKELFVNTVCFKRRDSQQIDSNNRELFRSLKEKTYKEVNLLSNINHENIVKEYGYFEENNTCYIVMEYVDGKNLNQFLKFDSPKFSEVEAKELLKQLISGLKEVYNKKIIHRDINPSNILKTRDGIYKLIDFNSLKYMSNGEVSITGTGTNSFIAPELATRNAKVGIFSDIYSIGMTLFSLLQNEYTPEIFSPLILHTTNITQLYPSYTDRLFEEKDMVYNKIESFSIDDKFKRILKKMLELRSEDRYQSLEEIEGELFNGKLNKENYNDSSKKLILFISTVNSNHETWRDFSKIINKDTLFNSFDIGYLDYNSSLVANKNLLQKFLPMIFRTQSLPNIKDMADMLRTEIEYRYKEYDEIYLVTHSVGGLIAKQYLYDMYEDNLPIKIRKVMFYSVPNSHSDLIRFSSVYKDEKLKQSIHVLSNFEEWSQEIYLNSFIKTHYVIGKFDAIVNERSISPSFDSTNYSFVPRNHTDIVKLEDSNDISYIIFRDFILKE